MTDLAIEPTLEADWDTFCAIEDEIGHAESTGIEARWRCGRILLRYEKRQGSKRSPLAEAVRRLTAEFAVSETEMYDRRAFAEQYPDFSDASEKFTSWRGVLESLSSRPNLTIVPDPDPPVLPDGIYRTIVADPPWQYDNKATRGAAEDHYRTMSIAELCDLPVEEWAHDEAHLYLWTTNGFLREAFDVMAAWGFAYKTTLTWVKPQLGMGNYFRSSTEHVLFGVRGGLRTLDSNQINWFKANRGKHSEKPGGFFDLVEKVSPAPYLEMFARRARLGDWRVWGNEV